MYKSCAVKNVLEKIHIDFLCSNFRLKNGGPIELEGGLRAYPDLLSDDEKAVFELKSKIFPKEQERERIRPQTDFEWWELYDEQIKRYEALRDAKGVGLFWIFLLGHMKKEPTKTEDLNKQHIQKRDIYIADWDVYNLVEQNDSKRVIGLARLKRECDFQEHPVKKGRIYIAKNVEEVVGEYFGN